MSRLARLTTWLLASTALLLLLAWWYWPLLSPEPVPQQPKPRPSSSPGIPAKAAVSKPSAALRTSPLAVQLNATSNTARQDLEVLHELMQQYFTSLQTRPGPPLGSSRDLARALTGRNPLKLTVIAPDHPAINAAGYLTDRWGTPYHLHQLSSRRIDLRSAGPDKALFTTDDVVFPENP